MTITLPLEVRRFARVRVLHKESWGGKETSAGGWAPVRMRTKFVHGLEVLDWERVALPALGAATMQFQYGRFQDRSGRSRTGQVVGGDAATAAAARQGTPWDPDSMHASAPDLANHEIRIQVAEGIQTDAETEDLEDPAWRTVYWGKVMEQTDEMWGAAGIPSGVRTYHCLDGLVHLRDWRMNRHGFYSGGARSINAPGHPGYNTAPDQQGGLIGNKEASGATYTTDGDTTAKFHTWPGMDSMGVWTDKEALTHALVASRPINEPLFTVNDAEVPTLLTYYNAWRVSEGEPVLAFVSRMLDRSRGLGLAFCDWDDDSGAPDGPLTCKITISSQLDDGLTYVEPKGGVAITIPSADVDRLITVDIIGDHRVRGFSISDQNMYRYDYLESEGEQIELLATIGKVDGTLEKGWTDASATAFDALDLPERIAEWYRKIYQFQRIPRAFAWMLGDGNGGTTVRFDYSCDDNGQPIVGTSTTATSMLVTRILDDLPLLEGYDYTSSTPVRKDGETEDGQPKRRGILALIRADDDLYRTPEQVGAGLHIQLSPDGIFLYDPADQSFGSRSWGYPEAAALSWERIVLTVAFQLPHRVRMATGAPGVVDRKRRLLVRHADLHYWLASPGAIWEIDGENLEPDGVPVKRSACGGNINNALRDDRNKLARRHWLSVLWYTVHQNAALARRAVTYSFADCGFLETYTDIDGTVLYYPRIGDIIVSIQAGGQFHDPRTPVTRIHYDHVAGVTTISTSWVDLDWRNG